MANINDRVTTLEVKVNEIVIPQLNNVSKYVEDNKPGIRTASLLDSKIVTTVIYAIVAVGIYVAAKIGG